MKVLHIANSISSQAYVSLFVGLSYLGVKQSVFAYFRGYVFRTAHLKEQELSQLDVKYLPGVKWWHRIWYHRKLHYVYEGLKQQFDPAQYDIVHAETLFSDGGIAFKVWQHYKTPYIVNVRSTDVDVFLRFLPHVWGMGRRILLKATKIVFISPALQRRFCRHPLIKSLLPEIASKFEVCPNAIDSYWLDHLEPAAQSRKHQVLYVGNFSPNKNVVRLMAAVLRVRRLIPDIQLILVGDGGKQKPQMLKLVQRYPEVFQYRGAIYDKEKLLALYRSCSVFAMPSLHETFGLVYIEALSQGCRVLYTKSQGIDGVFSEQVGQRVNARSVASICRALQTLLQQDATTTSINFEDFKWENIARKYMNLYFATSKVDELK